MPFSEHDDDVAPLAIAGDRVNRECYMQVRGDGCTTPTLVRVFVSLDFKPYVTPEGFEPSQHELGPV